MSPSKIILLVFGGLLALFLVLLAMFGWWYTVDEGERGVYLRNGAVIGTAEPGLGFKLPIIDSVVKVSVQQQAFAYDAAVYSKDQQTAHLMVSVTYGVPAGEVASVYSRFGGIDGLKARLIDRHVNEQAEIVFGRYNAISAVQDRAKLSLELSAAIKKAISGPVTIHSVQLENIDFSDAYEKSIEERMKAEVEVQKLRQNAEREKVQAEIVVTQAKATADATRAQAQAQAEATKIKGDAEAYSIKVRRLADAAGIEAENNARLVAIQKNPLIVDYLKVSQWDGKLPSTMVPGGSVPMLTLQ